MADLLACLISAVDGLGSDSDDRAADTTDEPDVARDAGDQKPPLLAPETARDLLAGREPYAPVHDGHYYCLPGADEFDIALAYQTAATSPDGRQHVRQVFARTPAGDGKDHCYVRSDPEADWRPLTWTPLIGPPVIAVAGDEQRPVIACPPCVDDTAVASCDDATDAAVEPSAQWYLRYHVGDLVHYTE